MMAPQCRLINHYSLFFYSYMSRHFHHNLGLFLQHSCAIWMLVKKQAYDSIYSRHGTFGRLWEDWIMNGQALILSSSAWPFTYNLMRRKTWRAWDCISPCSSTILCGHCDRWVTARNKIVRPTVWWQRNSLIHHTVVQSLKISHP